MAEPVPAVSDAATIPGTVAERAVRGSIASAVAFLVTLGQTLVLVPVLLGSWGAEHYGLWLALQSLYGLIISLDTGHQTYVGNEFLRLFHTDRTGLRSMLSAGLLGAVLLGACQLAVVAGLIASGALPWALGQADRALPDEAALALVGLLAVWIAVGSTGGVLVRLYPPAGNFARSVWWGVAHRALVTMAICAAAISGMKLLGAVLASAAVTLLYVVFLWRDLRRHFSSLYPFWHGARLITAARNIARSIVVTGCALLAQLQQHGVIFVLSGSVGLAVIPAYTTTRTLANVFVQAASVVTAPLMPEMVRFSALREHDKLAESVRAIWFVTGLPVNLGLCVGLPFFEPLYEAWTRGRMPFDAGLFALLAVAISLRCFGAPLSALIAGLNALRAQVWINGAQTAAVLAVLLGGVPRWGLFAAGGAVVAGEIAGSVVVPLALMYRLEPETMRQLRWHSTLRALAPSLFVGAVLLAVATGLSRTEPAMAAGLLAGAVCYRLQWRALGPSVRARLLALGKLRRTAPRSSEG